jgi:hypothetical protein
MKEVHRRGRSLSAQRPVGRSRRAGQALCYLLGALACAAWLQGLRGVAALPRVAREARAMCEGLPDYAGLARDLGVPLVARVAVVVDPREERAGERFVCARLALAPRPVEARPVGEAVDGDRLPQPPAEFLLTDLGDAEGRVRLEREPAR